MRLFMFKILIFWIYFLVGVSWANFPANTTSPEDLIKVIGLEAKSIARETGVYHYTLAHETTLEKIIADYPEHVQATYMLSWIYSTYERNRHDEQKHSRSLVLAKKVFNLNSKNDIYLYEILGAAMYANSRFTEGDKFFDYAIFHARNIEMRDEFSARKIKIRAMYR